jgi:hypothetical protein
MNIVTTMARMSSLLKGANSARGGQLLHALGDLNRRVHGLPTGDFAFAPRRWLLLFLGTNNEVTRFRRRRASAIDPIQRDQAVDQLSEIEAVQLDKFSFANRVVRVRVPTMMAQA